MLEQIVKDMALSVRENVSAGMKAINDKLVPLIEDMKASQGVMNLDIKSALDSVDAMSASIEKMKAEPKADPVAAFAKAFTDEMSKDG